MAKCIWRSELSGGGINALDGMPNGDLDADDRALVFYNGELYSYTYDPADIQAEDLPNIIKPDDGGGSWIRGNIFLTMEIVTAAILTAAPRHIFMVYGDSTDGGTTPEAATQASIDALIAAGVPSGNIRWLYEAGTTLIVSDITGTGVVEQITLTLQEAMLSVSDVVGGGVVDAPTLLDGTTLNALDIVGGGVVEQITFTLQEAQLSVSAIIGGGAVELITISQESNLTVSDIVGSGVVEDITLTQTVTSASITSAELTVAGNYINITFSQPVKTANPSGASNIVLSWNGGATTDILTLNSSHTSYATTHSFSVAPNVEYDDVVTLSLTGEDGNTDFRTSGNVFVDDETNFAVTNNSTFNEPVTYNSNFNVGNDGWTLSTHAGDNTGRSTVQKFEGTHSVFVGGGDESGGWANGWMSRDFDLPVGATIKYRVYRGTLNTSAMYLELDGTLVKTVTTSASWGTLHSHTVTAGQSGSAVSVRFRSNWENVDGFYIDDIQIVHIP